MVTYGAETCTMKVEDENNLCIFERKIVRRIYGPVYNNGEWRIRSNIEIDQLLEGENIVSFIKSNRLRSLGHVVRMHDERLSKMIMNARMEGRRRRGRPRRRWMDDVQEDIASLGVRNWKTMASDSVQWRTVVREAKIHFGP